MPTAAATRTVAAAPDAVWEIVADPHHLPRWWPRVTRVEGVEQGAFTEVLSGKRGKVVRADFEVAEVAAGRRLVWSQQVDGTPFDRVLRSAVTTIELAAAPGAAAGETHVRIELCQQLAGLGGVGGGGGGRLAGWRLPGIARFGTPLVKRAAERTVEQALDGLERVFGDGG